MRKLFLIAASATIVTVVLGMQPMAQAQGTMGGGGYGPGYKGPGHGHDQGYMMGPGYGDGHMMGPGYCNDQDKRGYHRESSYDVCAGPERRRRRVWAADSKPDGSFHDGPSGAACCCRLRSIC